MPSLQSYVSQSYWRMKRKEDDVEGLFWELPLLCGTLLGGNVMGNSICSSVFCSLKIIFNKNSFFPFAQSLLSLLVAPSFSLFIIAAGLLP